jgi:hypothetical protein
MLMAKLLRDIEWRGANLFGITEDGKDVGLGEKVDEGRLGFFSSENFTRQVDTLKVIRRGYIFLPDYFERDNGDYYRPYVVYEERGS